MTAFGAGGIAGFLIVAVIVAHMSLNDALKGNKKRHATVMVIIFLSGIALFALSCACVSNTIATIGALLIMTPTVDTMLSLLTGDDDND